MNGTRYYIGVLAIVCIDQLIKLLVYFNMELGPDGQVALVGDWFHLHFVLNPGMAFGMQLGHEWYKLFLTIFRMLAIVAICWFLWRMLKRRAPQMLVWSIVLILGGAVGNVIDCVFYGVWLGNAPASAPMTLFHGQVVDMFYIDLWDGLVPDGIPIWGGEYISLWPVFNIADVSIFCGVCLLFMKNKAYLFELGWSSLENPVEMSEVKAESAVDYPWKNPPSQV